jgi:ABC-type sugar transport system ATPase subunit
VTVRTAGEPAIRVRGLEKSYGKPRVLRGVDLEVRASVRELAGQSRSSL